MAPGRPRPAAPRPRPAGCSLSGGGPGAAKPRVQPSNPAQRQATASLPAPSLGRVRGQRQVSQAEAAARRSWLGCPESFRSEPTALTLALLLPADKGLGVPSGGLPFRLLSPPSPLYGRTPATEKSAGRGRFPERLHHCGCCRPGTAPRLAVLAALREEPWAGSHRPRGIGEW